MNGREHLYWSLLSFSFAMFGYTIIFKYKAVGTLSYLALAVLFVLSILFLDMSNMVVSKVKRINKERNLGNKEDRKKSTALKKQLKTAGSMSEEESASFLVNKEKHKEIIDASMVVASSDAGTKAKLSPLESKMVNRLRILSFIFLGLIIIFVSYNSIAAVQDPSDLFIAFCMCAWGGRFPDLDRDIPESMEFHRNPVTHSGMYGVPAGLVAIVMIANDMISTSKILFFIGFIIGTVSHLIVDNIESESSLLDLLRSIKNRETCPGDIRHIREDRERHWLWMHVLSLMAMLVILFSRYEMMPFTAGFLSYDNYTYLFSTTSQAWILIGFVGIYFLLTFIAFFLWRKKEEVKKNKKAEGIGSKMVSTVPSKKGPSRVKKAPPT